MAVMSAASIDMTLEQIRDSINGLVQQGHAAQHQIGVLYNHVVARKLAELAGYKNAREYFNRHVKALSQATLSVYGTVARTFTEAVCTQYGMYNLRALITYAEAAGIILDADPGAIRVDVPQEDGKVQATPFTACSVDDIERATRAKRTPPPVRVPVPDAARLLFFEDSIYRHFSGVAQVNFSARSTGGKTVLSLQDVPMTEVTRLIQALREALEAQPSMAAK